MTGDVKGTIVHDASCLIDLSKGKLLRFAPKLPFRLIVPFPIRHSEVLDFTDREWRLLDEGGLETLDLSPEQVEEALNIRQMQPKLSANDCLCLALVRCQENAILLTGDRLLRQVAVSEGCCVHGVLWVIDELKNARACTNAALISALELWRDDRSVFLPTQEIERRLRGLRHPLT